MGADSRKFSRIGVIGMGYVGLTLAAALAREGYEIHGVEIQPEILASLSRGRPHIFEPGVAEIFADLVGNRIFVASELPAWRRGRRDHLRLHPGRPRHSHAVP